MDNGLNFAIGLDTSQLDSQTQHVRRQFESMGVSAVDAGGKIDNALGRIGRAAVSLFSLAGAADFARQIVRVRGEIESLEVSFRTLLGDEKEAAKLMGDIRKFAAQTPMQMDDLAAGAQTLLAFNIEAEKVMPTLRALGDISMGDSQKFQSLILAFSQMSSTGKLMGQDLGQMINAGFNPLAQISEKTGKSIGELKEEMSKGKISVDMVTEAFMDATSEGGKFAGMLEKQSHGIRGSFSNLQGAVQDMLNELGEKVQEPVTNALNNLQGLVQNYEKVGKVIGVLVATYGGYKAAVMVVTAVEKIAAGAEMELALARMSGITITKAQAAATLLQKDATLLLTKAQKMLNATMLRNPYVLAATAVIGLVSAIVLLRDRSTEAERAQAALQRTIEESETRQQVVKEETDRLIQTLDDATASTLRQAKALDRLKALYPDLLKDVHTYNDYLQQRKEILEGMPEAQEQKETWDEQQGLEKMKSDYAELLRLRERWQRSGNGSTASAEFAEYNAAWAKYQRQAAEAGYKGAFGANDKDVTRYLKETIDVQEAYIKDRMEQMRHADWMAKPIEQRIEITEDAVEQAKAKVAEAKAAAEKAPWNPILKLNLSTVEQQLKELQSQLDNLTAQKPVPIRIDLGRAVEDAKKALAKAQRQFRMEQTEANRKAVEDAQTNLDNAKKDYKLAYGKEYDQVIKAGQDRLKAQREADRALKKEQEEYAEWLAEQARRAVMAHRQAEIDAMKDGLDKTLRQIAFDYDEELAAIDEGEKELVERLRDHREKEWEAAHQAELKKGIHYDRSTVTASDLDQEQQQQITDARERALAKRQRLEQQSLADSLRDYQTYQQRRLAIEEEYARKAEALYHHDSEGNRMGLREGVTAEQVANLQKEGDRKLLDLDNEELKQSSEYVKFFASYLTLGADRVREIGQLIKSDLNNQLQAGTVTIEQWARGMREVEDIIGRATDGMSEIKALMDGGVAGLANLRSQRAEGQIAAANEDYHKAEESYTKAMIEGNTEAMRLADAQKSAALLAREGAEAEKEAADAAAKAASDFGSMATMAGKIADMLKSTLSDVRGVMESFGVDTDKAGWDYASVAVDTAAKGLGAAAKIASGDIVGGIKEAVSAVAGLISGLNAASDAEIERSIQSRMKEVDRLRQAYDDLGDAISKAYGQSKVNQIKEQEENLRRQNELLRQAYADEEDKKNTNNDRQDTIADKIQQNEKELQRLHESELEAIFGQDVQSAVDQLGDALVEAWAKGGNASRVFADTSRDWVKRALANVVKDIIATGQYVEQLEKKIRDALLDSIITDAEWADIEGFSDRLSAEAEAQLGNVRDRLRQLGLEEERRSATRGMALASQDSVNELNGRMTAVQGHTSSIKESNISIAETGRLMLAVSNDILGTVRHIDSTTTDMHILMGSMSDEIQTVRRSLSQLEANGIRLRR